MNPFEYAKAIAALLGAVVTAILGVAPDVPVWLVMLGAALTAVATFAVPNKTSVGKHVATEQELTER